MLLFFRRHHPPTMLGPRRNLHSRTCPRKHFRGTQWCSNPSGHMHTVILHEQGREWRRELLPSRELRTVAYLANAIILKPLFRPSMHTLLPSIPVAPPNTTTASLATFAAIVSSNSCNLSRSKKEIHPLQKNAGTIQVLLLDRWTAPYLSLFLLDYGCKRPEQPWMRIRRDTEIKIRRDGTDHSRGHRG